MTKRFKDWISKSAANLKSHFYLNDWEMRIVFADRQPDDMQDGAMCIETDSTYLRFRVTVFPAVYDDWKDGRIEAVREYLLHEFCHIVLDPIYSLAKESMSNANREFYIRTLEQQTQRLMAVIYPNLPKHIFPKV